MGHSVRPVSRPLVRGVVRSIAGTGSSAAPPTIISQTLLADGVTIRCVGSVPLTTGDAVGLTRSVGTITSASVVGGNLDIVIPKAYAGDSIGTLTYDGTGTLAGATGAVAAFGPVAITNSATAWTPAELQGIVDYMVWSDLTRLFQNSDGTGAVASVDDPIGYMRGQLDVLTYRQATAGNKPKLAAAGIDFVGNGAVRALDSTTQYGLNNSLTIAGQWNSVSSDQSQFAIRIAGTGSEWSFAQSSGAYRIYHRGATTQIATKPSAGTHILTGTPTAATAYKDGVSLGAITAGTGTNTSTLNRIQSGGNGNDSRVGKAWIFCHGAGADIDATEEARLRAWMAAQ